MCYLIVRWLLDGLKKLWPKEMMKQGGFCKIFVEVGSERCSRGKLLELEQLFLSAILACLAVLLADDMSKAT